MRKVSLYIPCYNAERFVAHSIEAALLQTHLPSEILVIDDGSTDNTRTVAARYPVRIITHECNRGLGAARNTGVRESSSDLVASLDADCVPQPDWLEKLVSAVNDEKVAGAGGRLMERYHSSLPDRWRKLHMTQDHGLESLANPGFLYGSNTLFKKPALESIGLYNEKLRTNAEDCDISWRLYRAGYSLSYRSDAEVEHLRTDTIPSIIRTYWRWNFHGYLNDMTLYNTLRTVAYHVVRRLPSCWEIDFSKRQWDCALLSCAVVGHAVIADLAHYVRHRGERKLLDL